MLITGRRALSGITSCVSMKRSFVVLFFLLGACTTDRERADKYYDQFSAIIVPYKEGTESILTEMQRMLKEQVQRSGDIEFFEDDSVKQRSLVKQFETLANKTLEDLQQMDELEGADLKTSGMQYVISTTGAVVGVYREIVLPMQDPNRKLDQEALDSLSVKYSDQLVASNDAFADAQMGFLKQFGLLFE